MQVQSSALMSKSHQRNLPNLYLNLHLGCVVLDFIKVLQNGDTSFIM